MRKESTHRWAYALLALLGTAAVLGLLYHFQVRDMLDSAGPSTGSGAQAAPVPGAAPPDSAEGAPETGNATILTCESADGSTWYTNAPTCDEQDLDNRLSVVEAFKPAETVSTASSDCLSSRVREEEAARLFLPECREDFMEALSLERRLLSETDPAQSRLAADYCALIGRGVANGCPATSDQFCLLSVCQQRLEAEKARSRAPREE